MKSLKDIQDKITNKEKIHFIFDYNTRITPYVRTNMSYFFSPMFKRIIENLAKKEFVKISIITDKNIKNFKKEFPIQTENIDIYGVLGGEAEKRTEKKCILDDNYKKALRKLYNSVSKKFTGNPKAILEFEDWSIIANTKGLAKKEIRIIKNMFNDFVENYSDEIIHTVEDENRITIIPKQFRINKLVKTLAGQYEDYASIYIGKDESTYGYINKKCSTLKIIVPGDSMESNAELVVYRSKFEEFLADLNNLYL